MRLDKIWTVARKDLAEFRTNKYVMYSILLMPLLLSIVLPVIYLAPFSSMVHNNQPLDVGHSPDMVFLDNQTISDKTYTNTSFNHCTLTNVIAINCRFEASNITNTLIRDSYVGNSSLNNSAIFHSNYQNDSYINSTNANGVDVSGRSSDQMFLTQFINFLLIFFVMIPVILPTVMASYSFVGEKLNRSLEPLLATPTTDSELLAGKALSIFLPCMIMTWLSFIPFVLIVDAFTTGPLGYAPLPDAIWLIGVFILSPLFCVTSIALNVVVSSRVSDVRASQQIGSLVVLPVVVFFVVSLAGFFTLGPEVMLLLCGLVLLVDLGIAYLSLKTFQREQILIRWK
jgi:ABC-2 type transport system permease protein